MDYVVPVIAAAAVIVLARILWQWSADREARRIFSSKRYASRREQQIRRGAL